MDHLTAHDRFDQLNSAHAKGNATGELPREPSVFIGKAIELNAPALGQAANTSVIER
jgi:hypothetical protein